MEITHIASSFWTRHSGDKRIEPDQVLSIPISHSCFHFFVEDVTKDGHHSSGSSNIKMTRINYFDLPNSTPFQTSVNRFVKCWNKGHDKKLTHYQISPLCLSLFCKASLYSKLNAPWTRSDYRLVFEVAVRQWLVLGTVGPLVCAERIF